MATHHVDFTLPQRQLGKTDVIFQVKADEAILGTLHVSRGAVVWFPKGHKKGHKLGWSKFGEMMAREGTHFERR